MSFCGLISVRVCAYVSVILSDFVELVCSCPLQGRGSFGGVQQRRGYTKLPHASMTPSPLTPSTFIRTDSHTQ